MQANVLIAGDDINIGQLIVIDDQPAPTARYGLSLWGTASNVNIKRMIAQGAFTTGAIRNDSSNNIKITDIQVDDAPELQNIIT